MLRCIIVSSGVVKATPPQHGRGTKIMQYATVESIAAVNLICPECREGMLTQSESFLWTPEDMIVAEYRYTCGCGTISKLPADAFYVAPRKSKPVGKEQEVKDVVPAANTKIAGWARPLAANRYHYFPADDHTAICGGWFYGGEREEGKDTHSDNCAACKKKLVAMRAKAAKKVTS